MPVRSPDPGTFEHLLTTVDVPLSDFWRLTRLPATEPYWAKSATHRFDDPNPVAAARFGVLYAGQNVEVAFCESVIHDNNLFVNGRFEVTHKDLNARSLISFTHPTLTSLSLVDLTGDSLKHLGLNGDICSLDDYAMPQAWAAAIHAAHSTSHGIRFVSRQRNSHYCYALFERSALQVLEVVTLSKRVKAALCHRLNVKLV